MTILTPPVSGATSSPGNVHRARELQSASLPLSVGQSPEMGNFQLKRTKEMMQIISSFLVSGGWERLPHLGQSKLQEVLSPV